MLINLKSEDMSQFLEVSELLIEKNIISIRIKDNITKINKDKLTKVTLFDHGSVHVVWTRK